jgi:protein-arginine kinase activator protein McsA
MICAKCNKQEATVHFTAVTDGKAPETVHLCKVCAAACGLRSVDANEAESWEAAWEEQLHRKAVQILKERRRQDGGDKGS